MNCKCTLHNSGWLILQLLSQPRGGASSRNSVLLSVTWLPGHVTYISWFNQLVVGSCRLLDCGAWRESTARPATRPGFHLYSLGLSSRALLDRGRGCGNWRVLSDYWLGCTRILSNIINSGTYRLAFPEGNGQKSELTKMFWSTFEVTTTTTVCFLRESTRLSCYLYE